MYTNDHDVCGCDIIYDVILTKHEHFVRKVYLNLCYLLLDYIVVHIVQLDIITHCLRLLLESELVSML